MGHRKICMYVNLNLEKKKIGIESLWLINSTGLGHDPNEQNSVIVYISITISIWKSYTWKATLIKYFRFPAQSVHTISKCTKHLVLFVQL